MVDHMLGAASRQDGHKAFFPLIPEIIEDPAEIWIGFAKSSESGRVLMRRRYVKLVRVEKDRVVGIVADSDNGIWSGMTFFRGRRDALKRLRTGLRIHQRDGG